MVPIIRAWSTHGTAAVARASGLLVLAFAATAGVARADVQTIDGVNMPIVRVNVQQGNVTIRTWDRQSVQIDADPALKIVRRLTNQSGAPYPVPIPDILQSSPLGIAELPAESFVATLPPGPHDAIIIRDVLRARGEPPTPVTVTIPNNSVFVFARTGDGTLDVKDYRSGTFVGFVGRGRMLLNGIGGTVFAQTARGPMIVTDSAFDRFRGRSLFGNVTFERCDARQIETSTIFGSIVYDRGTFAPGLAHFETQNGDVAVGSDGPVQFGGHASSDGHVYTNFTHAAHVDKDNEGNATIGTGGPVVTAMTQRGNVFFYDGSLRSRQQLAAQWQAPIGALQRPGSALRRDLPLPTNPPFVHSRIPDYRQSPSQDVQRRTLVPKRPNFDGQRFRARRGYMSSSVPSAKSWPHAPASSRIFSASSNRFRR